MNKTEYSMVSKLVYEHTPIDRILDIDKFAEWNGGYCYEVIGTAGGDALTFRFYFNANDDFAYVTER